jgi:hypothetical protein
LVTISKLPPLQRALEKARYDTASAGHFAGRRAWAKIKPDGDAGQGTLGSLRMPACWRQRGDEVSNRNRGLYGLYINSWELKFLVPVAARWLALRGVIDLAAQELP